MEARGQPEESRGGTKRSGTRRRREVRGEGRERSCLDRWCMVPATRSCYSLANFIFVVASISSFTPSSTGSLYSGAVPLPHEFCNRIEQRFAFFLFSLCFRWFWSSETIFRIIVLNLVEVLFEKMLELIGDLDYFWLLLTFIMIFISFCFYFILFLICLYFIFVSCH